MTNDATLPITPATTDGSAARALWRLVPLVAIVLTAFLTIGIPLPVLGLQVHEHLGYGTLVVGLVVGVQSIATVLTRGVAGRIADERGPKRAVLLGLPLAVLSGAAYLASTAVAGREASLAVLVLGRVFLGVAESLVLTGTMTWGIARVGPKRTGMVMAWQGIALYAALAAGAPVGTALMAGFGFRGVALATILLPLVAIAIALALPAVLPSGGRRLPFLKVVGLIWRFGLTLGLATAPFAGMAAFLALDYAAKGWSGAGLALTGFGVGYILVRLVFGHLPDALGGRTVALVSLAIEAIGQTLLWAAPTATAAFIGATVTGLGFSLMFPAMGVEAVRRVPAESRGLAVGGFIAFFDLALGLTGPLAGLLAGAAGYPVVFLAGAASCLAALACVAALPRPVR